MSRSAKPLLILTLLGAGVACTTARNPARGFRLAANGDPDRGKAAELPRPTVQPVIPGG